MKITVDKSLFVREFELCGRDSQFSQAGLEALFDHYEEFNEDYELDVTEICCDWQEFSYDEEDSLLEQNGIDDIDQLHRKTTVLDTGESWLVLNY